MDRKARTDFTIFAVAGKRSRAGNLYRNVANGGLSTEPRNNFRFTARCLFYRPIASLLEANVDAGFIVIGLWHFTDTVASGVMVWGDSETRNRHVRRNFARRASVLLERVHDVCLGEERRGKAARAGPADLRERRTPQRPKGREAGTTRSARETDLAN